MLESRIEHRLVERVKRLGGHCIKGSATGFNGMPDRMVLYRGKVYFIELKAPGEKPRKIQLHVQKQLIGQGFDVRTIDSLEGIDGFIKEIGGGDHEV